MCGILGLFTTSKKTYNFNYALEKIKHRGPNSRQSIELNFEFGKLFLGHARLSIIDLSDTANQPMYSIDKKFVIVFNGEIYNYKELKYELIQLGSSFLTNSDTEVLLECWKLWGPACLNKLNGMFAFSIFDFNKSKLFCCRDAFGIKPLFYSNKFENFIFGSEIQSIISINEELNNLNQAQAISYLKFGKYDREDFTFFKDINSVLPGHYLEIDLKNDKTTLSKKWWNPSVIEKSEISYKEAVDKTRSIFLENVKLNLRSDVPLGAALSGGLDSSAIVCSMRYLEPKIPINTFSFIDKNFKYSEENWVDLVNKFTDSTSHKIVLNPTDLFTDLNDLIKTQGEPFMSTSIYAQYCIYKKVNSENIVVTLDGQGADEQLAGYNGYPEFYLKSLFKRKKYLDILIFLNNWSKWPGRSLNDGFLRFLAINIPDNFINYAYKIINKDNNKWLIDSENLEQLFSTNPKEIRKRFLVNKLLFEQTRGGLQSLLRHGDRNSMRWSIESRVPFLSINFSEHLLSLPEKYLLSDEGRTKNIFRDALVDIVPNEIINRKDKIGFKTPEYEWLKMYKNNILGELNFLNEIPFINSKICSKDIELILNGKVNYTPRVWRYLNFSIWAKNNNIKLI